MFGAIAPTHMPPTRILAALALATSLASLVNARTFTDDKGRKIEAELLSVDGSEVTLNKGGRKFTLPVTRFSQADQKFIREWASSKATTTFNLGYLSSNPKPVAPPAVTTPPKPGVSPPADLPKPKPGATLTLKFPELEKDFNGKPAAVSVRIPKSYDPSKPVPLFIFLGGGKGSSSPGGALSLTRDDFVCAGLPYPNSGRSPWQANMVGRPDIVWAYWKPMLARLHAAIPNLDPRVRIIGGFSNGAHAIDALLANREFGSAFSAFVLIEGGGSPGGNYQGVKGKHIYYAWGDKSPIARSAGVVLSRARQGGMRMRSHAMKDTGHQFPKTEKTAVQSWLYETVIPDLKRSR